MEKDGDEQDWSGYVGTPISAEQQRKQDIMKRLLQAMAPEDVREVPTLRLVHGGRQ